MKDEVLEYCNSSDVNIPLIETSAKVGYTVTRWNDYRRLVPSNCIILF